MYIPNISGIHDSDVVVSQQGLCITPSGIRFHSDHDECQNVIVGFPLAYEDTQDSKSYLHGIGNVISDSKYLEATQSLLHDAVNVKKALNQHFKNESFNNSKKVWESEYEPDSIPVTPSEKQDLQNKMTKLSSMLNEVDRRYKQYYHEIQIVVSSFNALAGHGASIPYTALTLQSVSRQFRFLKDAIKSQIQVMSTRLGKTDSDGEGIRIPRLRFVDQKVRVQQLGRVWRPQRGLPERSVSILRAWLFEHFLHPYPKDSDKNMLARQTGLTRSQVANWFINARVRLWKPMVEEMYKQESIIL